MSVPVIIIVSAWKLIFLLLIYLLYISLPELLSKEKSVVLKYLKQSSLNIHFHPYCLKFLDTPTKADDTIEPFSLLQTRVSFLQAFDYANFLLWTSLPSSLYHSTIYSLRSITNATSSVKPWLIPLNVWVLSFFKENFYSLLVSLMLYIQMHKCE